MKTPKEIAFEFGLCTCENPDEEFSLGCHDCAWHNFDIKQAMEKYADQFKPIKSVYFISFLLNTDTGERKQYAGFTYTKINGIYGYLGIDNGKDVIFIYSDERGVVMDVMDNYKVVVEATNLK